MSDYLDDARGGMFRGGYEGSDQLFIMFGYTCEAPNKVLAKLVAQTCMVRLHGRQHCWLFMPWDRVEMSARWDDGGALRDVKGFGRFPANQGYVFT